MDDDYYQIENTYFARSFPHLLKTPAAPFLKDFSLVCEKKEIQAHKLVLAMHSKFFEDMFIKRPELNCYHFLPNISFEDLEGFLEYMYTGKLTYRRSRIRPLMELFYDLRVRGFVDIDDGVVDYKALVADVRRNSGNVHNRENLDASANAGLDDQPSENNDHQASTAVVDKVHKDNDHQESLLPAATVVYGVNYVLDANNQDLSSVPPPVDQVHNTSSQYTRI